MTDSNRQQRDPTEPNRPRRPILLTALFWIFVLWTALGWMRFTQTLGDRQLIESMASNRLYGYLLFAGFLWGLLGLPVLWGLLCRAYWLLKILWIAALFYPAFYWFERLAIWADPNAQSNWPLMLLLTALWAGLVVWVYQSKRIRRFLKKDDQKDE